MRVSSPATCPVCCGRLVEHVLHIRAQDYWRCRACEARLLDPQHLPGRDVEYAHYLLHENDPHDDRYRAFLAKLAVPLLEKLGASEDGLDYGCGPGPALAMMLGEAGHTMALYDPYFNADTKALERKYDFITCTETAEHFHRPGDEFDRLDTLLRPGGWLAVMTCFQTDDARFANWHYRQDPTHVVFYRAATFEVIAAQRGWTCEFPCKDVAIMQKTR
jgi:hypothetical protein